jgi:hypothetical protein
MTQPQSAKRARSWGKTLAAALAAILVVAQCLAVTHYHSRPSSSIHSSDKANFDDGGLCALCLFHQYSPGFSPATYLLFSPGTIASIDLYSAESWPLYTFNSYLSGRSPPAAS